MENPEIILQRLSKSRFRSSFPLDKTDITYINKIGLDKIKEHCHDFLNARLRIKQANDGKQTPWRGHPVFKAQHALALCCRGCMQKWYRIDKNRELTDEEIRYFAGIIMTWIERESGADKTI